MRVVINFLLKLLMMPLVGIVSWCFLIMALVMWDKTFMEISNGQKELWHKPKH